VSTAVIYTRVSRAKVGARSVEDQEKECRDQCVRNGWDVRAVYCDNSIGASRHSVGDRPQWKKLQKDLRSGDILVVWEASRAQRDLEEFVALRNLCARLEVPLSYAGRVLDLTLGDDRFVGGLDALIAEREAEQIRTRVLRGKRAAAADGRAPGRPPWGYRRVDTAKWEPDPVEAPRIRQAVERLLSGESQYSILRWLQATGRAPTVATNLRRALCNPALAGLYIHNGDVVGKAQWQPIITEEQHHQLVGRGKAMKRAYGFNSQPGPEPKHLLSGLAMCGKCGEGLRRRTYANRKSTYECRMGHVARLAEDLDRTIEKRLFDRLSKVNPTKFEGDTAGVSAALGEIGKIEEHLEEWIAKSIAGEVTAAAFSRIEKGLRERITSLQPQASPPQFGGVDLTKIQANWGRMPMREKRAIVRAFFRITVKPIGRVRALPGDVDITPI
jgi:site-specific DNA recombinase